MSELEMQGHCDQRFHFFLHEFEKQFKTDHENGAAFALMIDGEPVVDIWAGYADKAQTKPWERDTLVFVASTSKIACSLCALMLVDRGLLDLDECVATYWPEFAQAGKENIPVRTILSHTSGLAGIDGQPSWDEFSNWDDIIRRIEIQEPMWEPGTQSGYHAITFGFLIGKLVRNLTGHSLPSFFKTEVTDKVDAAFHLGLPDDAFDQLSEVWFVKDEAMGTLDVGPLADRVFGNKTGDMETTSADPTFLKSDIPAANGVANARGLARVGDILACGGTSHGIQFLGPVAASLPYQEQSYTQDFVLNAPVRFGVGFGMASKEIPIPFEKAFHWGGMGGSSMVMIPECKASIAYTPNKFYSGHGADSRSEIYGTAVIIELLKQT